MSRHLAQIGVPGQVLDVLAGGDVDTAGRVSRTPTTSSQSKFSPPSVEFSYGSGADAWQKSTLGGKVRAPRDTVRPR